MIGGSGLWSIDADNSKKQLIFEGEDGWRGYVRVWYEVSFMLTRMYEFIQDGSLKIIKNKKLPRITDP